MHRLARFLQNPSFELNILYTCPNDEIFYRLKVKTLPHVFLVLSFCKFGRLEAQNGPTPLEEAQTPV